MRSELKTFVIRDEHAAVDETAVTEFLRSVDIERLETIYVDGGWRILVLYQDTRRREETVQIESAITGALKAWRADVARNFGVERTDILSDLIVAEIARFAPTTYVELMTIGNSLDEDLSIHGNEIVDVVRFTLDELSVETGPQD